MDLRNVQVIGGGPAGLFAATLLRRAMPAVSVTVHERSVPDETFGFGVAFTRRTLDALEGADDAVVAELRRASIPMPAQEMRIGGASILNTGNQGGITIARSALLKALLAQARAAGVEVRLGSRATLSQLAEGADLVIAADGVASATRAQIAPLVGAHVQQGRGLFMWLGCDKRLDTNLFAPVPTEAGLFNIHCYPYSEDRSTIGVETDMTTWLRAGMKTWADQTPADASDDRSIAYLQGVFGGVLDGARLLGNRSRWAHFRTVTVDRWSHDNVVLIGDAAHTAHYSVGSGTKMAMEDAASLVTALQTAPSVGLTAALTAYEAKRRPRVEKLQTLADRSRWWWESLAERVSLPPPVLMVAYLSRGGVISTTRLAESDPALLRSALSCAGLDADAGDPGRVATQIVANPIRLGGGAPTSRILADTDDLEVYELAAEISDPWGEEAAALVRKAQAFDPTGAGVMVLTGSLTREALLDRLAVAEHVRKRCRLPVAVDTTTHYLDDVADGIVAGRIDMVRFTDLLSQPK